MSGITKYVFKKGERIPGTRLTPIAVTTIRKYGKPLTAYECLCDCGRKTLQPPNVIGSGAVKSCGCLRDEENRKRSVTHGLSRQPEYFRAWSAWKRCNDESNSEYHNYGGRGIKCEFESVEAMAAWLIGNMPIPKEGKWYLDRIDNDGNYSPSNLKWSTPAESARNRRGTHPVTIGSVTKILVDWARDFGIPPMTLHARIKSGIPQDLWSHKGKITDRMLLEREFNNV